MTPDSRTEGNVPRAPDGGGPRPDVTVVIVNFNAGEHLRAALVSLANQDAGRMEIVLVDNGSTDASVEAALADPCPAGPVRVIRAGRNLGFARACNMGLAKARAHEILLLNPDCQMFPGALAALRGALAQSPEAGMAGARLVNPDGSEQRGARRAIPTPWTIFCEVLRLPRLMPRHPRFRSFNWHLETLPDSAAPVPAVSGACMLVRRDSVAEVGTLDEDFFLHFEDLDWCLRFNEAARPVLFAPDAVVQHVAGVCSASAPVRTEREKHRSLIRFLRKHFTSYYPSSFMALVAAMVMARFLVLAPSLILTGRRPRRPVPIPHAGPAPHRG